MRNKIINFKESKLQSNFIRIMLKISNNNFSNNPQIQKLISIPKKIIILELAITLRIQINYRALIILRNNNNSELNILINRSLKQLNLLLLIMLIILEVEWTIFKMVSTIQQIRIIIIIIIFKILKFGNRTYPLVALGRLLISNQANNKSLAIMDTTHI